MDTADGRPVRDALGQALNPLEEMKSDLISLYAVPYLLKTGLYDARIARSVYANGIRRVLLKNRPRRDQDYGTMQLIQLNWFIEHGLLAFDVENRTLKIDYAKYHEIVEGLLRAEVVLDAFRCLALFDPNLVMLGHRLIHILVAVVEDAFRFHVIDQIKHVVGRHVAHGKRQQRP